MKRLPSTKLFLLYFIVILVSSCTPNGKFEPINSDICVEQACLAHSSDVQITNVSVKKLPPRDGALSEVYSITADQETFTKNIEVKLPLPGGLETKNLAVAFWKEGRWEPVPSNVSEDKKYLVGSTNHLSEWAIIDKESTTARACVDGSTRVCGKNIGLCSQGTQTCTDGSWGDCVGETPASEEVCDGKDNDCDGQVDEELVKNCTNGSEKGNSSCVGGKWTPCQGGSIEICDGKDNDGDGEIDEGITRACGTSVGECQAGTQACKNGTWGLCQGEIKPSSELCDGKDNDCDGQTDEHLRKLCPKGSDKETSVCEGGNWSLCDLKGNEICDGKDNDGDGKIDEGLEQDCGSNVGTCKYGKQLCSNGSWGECKGGVKPTKEVCDSKDNDCDGQVDESITQQCGTDVGECTKGTQWCRNGAWGLCNGKSSTSEVCDNKDNDCDGQVDEELTKTCPTGSKNKNSVCKAGFWSDCGTPTNGEVCDGKDNNGNGLIDEGILCLNCPSDFPDACNSVCVDKQTSQIHCGSCNHACASGELCVSGKCTKANQGKVQCGGAWVDIQTDENNCGKCGESCKDGLQCYNRQCVCPPLWKTCNGKCINPTLDENNCGECGKKCGQGKICRRGICREVGILCKTKPNNTPMQKQCAKDEYCASDWSGHPVCTKELCYNWGPSGANAKIRVCFGACYKEDSHDPACPPEQPLNESGYSTSQKIKCAQWGMDTCGTTGCIKLEESFQHCGKCNVRCAAQQICSRSKCVDCPSGKTICVSHKVQDLIDRKNIHDTRTCVDLTSDSLNCGKCGIKCTSGQKCLSGKCQ